MERNGFMGYYDNDEQNRSYRQRGSKRGYFFTGLIGVIIGALIVLIAFPMLSGVIPSSLEGNQQVQDATQAVPSKTQNLSLNVNTDVTKAVGSAEKTVVGITNIQKQSFWGDLGQGGSSGQDNQGQGDPSQGSQGSQGSQSQEQPAATGSGIIYKKAGGKAYIVTNYHVVSGADQLEVTLSDGTKLPAKLRGGDMWSDLAIVEVDGSKIGQVAQFGNSDSLKLGEPVIAIGNPLGEEFSGSVTEGVVSGLNRTVPIDLNEDGVEDYQEEVIQTDAAINPGNSGGALINIAGQVIGINSMKIAQSAVEGIGFSIPINTARPIIQDLEEYGKVKRPAMGVQLQNVSDIPQYHQQETLKLPNNVTDGVIIQKVSNNSPAQAAGLKELDVITALDGHKVQDIISLRKYLYEKKKPGDSLKVQFYRNGVQKQVTLKLTDESNM
jgi:serine protease Do